MARAQDTPKLINNSLVHLRGEGQPIHPDDIERELSDKQYEKQLNAYQNAYKVYTPNGARRT